MRIVVRRRGKKMCYRHWWYFVTQDTGEITPGWQYAIEKGSDRLRILVDAETYDWIYRKVNESTILP
jgi:hypothetical protein